MYASTLRCVRPNDRVLSACCWKTAARNRLRDHLAAIKMIKMQGGVFGAVANSAMLISHLP